MERKPVDIIIPIYNAYEDLRKCIKSVKQYTDLTFDRLVLINDCSPDERIMPYLEYLREDNILVINNEKNKGFSGNVNLGMGLTEDRDVILLNSDTVVTKNWVNKIVECAYSAEEIGTVTPLSNSATLCSTPIMCQDNKIPEGFTIQEYADLIERCSLRKYPRITVAVGFCMFIKRNVIKEVGWFDAETFERGYGEENDFCNRAEQLGYIHVMCDDTFIYHKGTVSFVNEEKQKLIDAHDRILQERYPVQMRNNHLYCMNNPDQYIRDNINLYAELRNGKKNLMYVLHLDFREDAVNNVGGTQFHVRDLVENLKDDYNIFVFARVQEKIRLSIYANDRVKTLEFDIGQEDSFPKIHDRKQKEVYENVLKAFNIQLVHVHHTHGLSFDIFYEAKRLGIPVYLTLHDFYYVCPNEKLLSSDIGYCTGKTDEEHCKKCLFDKVKIAQTVPFLGKWREECHKVLAMCDKLITPSNSAKEIYAMYYPDIADRIIPIYHGSEFVERKHDEIAIGEVKVNPRVKCNWDHIFTYSGDSNAVIGWCVLENINCMNTNVFVEMSDDVGNVKYTKARHERRMDVAAALGSGEYEYSGFRANLFKEEFETDKLKIRIIVQYGNEFYTDGVIKEFDNKVIEKKRKNFNIAFVGGMVEAKGSKIAFELIKNSPDNINWYVMGNIGDADLANLETDNLYKTGGYEKDNLKKLLDRYQIDLVCVLSVWPETFCYTISESLICGVPVLATDIGAMGERMRINQCGWLVDSDASYTDILEKIKEIRKNKGDYKKVKELAENYVEKSNTAMVGEYKVLYNECILNKAIIDTYNSILIFGGYKK
mgnify:CR=1 FL=1